MITKIVSSIKYSALIVFCFGLVVACEQDFENVGVDLINNNVFNTKDSVFSVKTYSQNVPVSRVDGIPQYLLGVYDDPVFGLVKSSFYGQLQRGSISSFGENVSIDAVVLNIPYYATAEDDNDDGSPNFKLDSIVGDQTIPFNLSIYELNTYLNSLNPLDPTKRKAYFSNDAYSKGDLIYSGDFVPNRNDTVLYVERRFIDSDPLTVDDRDTIKAENSVPSVKIALDTTYFRNKFINAPDGKLETNEEFINYFRGLAIESNGTNGSLMSLAMSNGAVDVYYTNTTLTDETSTDLNGDGDTDDTDVPVRTKRNISFPLSGLRTNNYLRDYTTSTVNISDKLDNPNTLTGEEKIYVQGASGSNGIIELFEGMDFNAIRDANWLINEASLTLYVDESSGDNVPERLFLYKEDYNSQIIDVFSGYTGIGGNLIRDEDNDNKPVKYEFSITDYFSELIASNENVGIKKFALKVYHNTDQPTSVIDTLVRNFSWTPKGVVLKGNLPETESERLQLKVFYTVQK